MRGRLFWKLLFAFWVAFFLITQGVWLFVWFLNFRASASERFLVERVGPAVLDSLGSTLAREGPAGARRQAEALTPDDRRRIRIAPVAETPPRYAVQRTAQAPDGRRYRLLYLYRGPVGRPGPLNTPPSLVILGLVGGPVFSALTAWYLTAPIRRLRRGFERLAGGDLGARLTPEMGRRRDEIADLARDLDAMAARLQDSVAARERLLHDVSHELRSPLTRLQLAIGLARQDPGRALAALDRVEYEAGRLETIVRKLLTLARAEAGQVARDGYFELAGLLDSVVADARYEAEAAGVAIDWSPPGDAGAEPPSVCGDAELVRWALENVLRNAVRFSRPGDTVAVALAFDPVAGAYVVQVADQGPGAAEAMLPSLFEPFVRGDDQGPGFGLGLAIARRAVAAHGGTIKAENRSSGGLRVRIRLPVGPGRA